MKQWESRLVSEAGTVPSEARLVQAKKQHEPISVSESGSSSEVSALQAAKTW